MSELQRLKSLLPPENESWVFIEAAAAIDPPLITLEEIGRDEVEIQIDLDEWENFAIDHRNLLFWHEVGKIQNDTIPRDGWEMAALAIGLGGALNELIDKTRKKKKRSFFEDRLDALRKSAEKARSELSQQEGSEKSVSSENVYGQ